MSGCYTPDTPQPGSAYSLHTMTFGPQEYLRRNERDISIFKNPI